MTTRELNGKQISFDEDGHMSEFSEWDIKIGKILAVEEGVEILSEKHLMVIDFMRSEYEKTGVVPTLREITKNSGVKTKEVYELYPGGPSRKAAKIGGLPKPKGCI